MEHLLTIPGGNKATAYATGLFLVYIYGPYSYGAHTHPEEESDTEGEPGVCKLTFHQKLQQTAASQACED